MANSNSEEWYQTATSTAYHLAPSNWYYAEQREKTLQMIQQYMHLGMMQEQTPQSTPSISPEKTLKLLKKTIREIKAEAVSQEAQQAVSTKINRLEKLGIKSQAAVLKAELSLRIRLARVMEWNYKVLPYDELKKFEKDNQVTATRDGLKVHIDKLEEYVGNTTVSKEKKDMIVPDSVLNSLETAKDRQVFDEFGVLWVEKVKDPLLLGLINGCKDYFLIDEWGEDIKFNDIIKEKDAKK